MTDRERLAPAAEDDLLVRDEARQPDRVDRRVACPSARPSPSRCPTARPASPRSGARRSPRVERPSRPPRRTASSGRRPARSSARGSTGRLPRAQRRSTASTSKPVVPITTGTPAARHASTFGIDRVGPREVDGRIAARRAPAHARRRPRARPRRAPARARSRPSRRRRRARRVTTRPSRAAAGFTRSTASANRRSSGPIPATERRSGARRASASSATSAGGHRLEALHDLLGRQQRRLGDESTSRAASCAPTSTRARAGSFP